MHLNQIGFCNLKQKKNIFLYFLPEFEFLLIDVLQPRVTEGLDGEPAHHLLDLRGEHGQGGEHGQQDTILIIQ